MFGTSAIAVFPLGTYRVFAVLVGQSACRLYMRAALRQDAGAGETETEHGA
jgi:hypothetical protein